MDGDDTAKSIASALREGLLKHQKQMTQQYHEIEGSFKKLDKAVEAKKEVVEQNFEGIGSKFNQLKDQYEVLKEQTLKLCDIEAVSLETIDEIMRKVKKSE